MKKVCILVGISISLLVTGVIVQAKKTRMQKDLAEEVFRFHVLANSDSKEDQALKMKVKEEVLAFMKEEIPNSGSVVDTKKWAIENLEQIAEVAQEVVCEEGYQYWIMAEVTHCDFPEKSYGDITFPAGEYETLRIEIGEGKGQNWWCVLYPNLCFVNAVRAVVPKEGKQQLRKVLEEDTYEMITSKTRFRIGWFFF